MDKKGLYFVIEKGTNVKETTNIKDEIWIGRKDKAEEKARFNTDLFKREWVPISIEDYEDTYLEESDGR